MSGGGDTHGRSATLVRAVATLVHACVARYRLSIGVALAVLVLAAPGIARLNLQLDGHALVPPDDPAVAVDRSIRETFQQWDPIVVFVEAPGPGRILEPQSLSLLSELTLAVFGYDELELRNLMSLASEGRDRIASMDYSPYLFPLPQTPQEIAELRVDIDAVPLLKGTLVAPDYSGASLLVQVPPGVDRQALYRKILATVAGFDAGENRIHVVGAPVAESQLGDHLLSDLARLLPLSGVLFAAALWLAFRRPAAIAVVMAHVGGCLVFTFGLMGWSGQPVFITTAILPVVLCTMAIASEVHLLAAAQRWRREDGRGGAAGAAFAGAVITAMWRPLSLTVLTTAIGFGSFVLSDLPPVRAFGGWATVGTLFSLAWSLCVTPALYRAAGAARLVRASDGRMPTDAAMGIVQRGVRSRWTVPVAAVLFVLLVAGVFRLQVQDGWITAFAPASAFRQSVERVNRSLLGTHELLVELDFSGRPAGAVPALQDAAVIGAVRRFEARLRAIDGVGGVLGPHSQLSATRFLVTGRAAGSEEVGADSPAQLRRLWRRMEFARGKHRRQDVADDAMQRGLVTLFLKNANYRQTAGILTQAQVAAAELLAPLGGQVRFGGDVAVSQAAITANVRGQLVSVAFGIVSLFAFLLLVLRRVSAAVFAVIPVLVACATALGAMGWAGVPVGIATSMFIAITLGIGIDFPLHLIERIDRERAAGAADPVARARVAVGPAILIDSVVVGTGFGLLALSQVPANAQLGALVALSVLASCVCTLLLARDRAPSGADEPVRTVAAKPDQSGPEHCLEPLSSPAFAVDSGTSLTDGERIQR